MSTLYLSQSCAPCHSLMGRLRAVPVLPDLEVKDITTDNDARSAMWKAGIVSTPAGFIGGQWHVGAPAILQALSQHYGVRL
jgi:hypothetical protein